MKNFYISGACRGYVSRHFTPDSVAKVTLCDTSQTHLDHAIVGEGVQFEKLVMDEEKINVNIYFIYIYCIKIYHIGILIVFFKREW